MNLQQEFLNLFNILATPTEVYGEINITPRWRIPFLFLVISSTIVGWFMIPAIMEPMRKIFASSFGQGSADIAIKGIMKSILVAQLLIEPLLKLARWLVLSAILFFITRLYVKGDFLLFKKLFSAVAYTESIFVLMSILTILIIYVRGMDNIEVMGDLTVFKGLDFFLKGKDQNTTVVTVLSNINPYSIWYVITIAFGVSVFTKLQKSQAFIIASASWLIWITISIVQSKVTAFLVGLIAGRS